MVDTRICKAERENPSLKEKCEEMRKAMTILKDLYTGHVTVVGKEAFETHNGVLQGAVTSPDLFSIYLESLLFADPYLKKLCDDQKLLAFADDMVVIAKSFNDVKTITDKLEKALQKGNLELAKSKSVIMTTRNSVLPTDIDDMFSDDEDSDPILKLERK